MAEMKAKHAFGSSANLESAIASGIIDNYDLLFLDGETDPKVGWIDKDGNVRIVKNADVKAVDSLSESGEIGKVYIYNDEGYFWNGAEYKPLSKSVDLTSLEEQIASKASLDEVTAKIDSEIAKIDATGTAESKVSEHNVSDAAHNDIRLLVQGLTERLNALADSDDTTLDQMSEVVAYIKSNKSLIDAITTSKINVSDIIDNLTTNVSNKPLSAAQGVALKTMIDAIATVELDETLTDNTKAAPAGMVGELKDKIDNIHIPKQVQPDWNQNDDTAADFVKNRPILPISEIANYGVGFKINTALKAVIINLTKDSNADGLTFINNTQYLKIYLGFNKKQIGIFQWYYDGEISFTNNTSNKVISGQCNKDRFNITYDADGNIVNSNVYFKCFGNQVLLASVDQQEDEYKTPSQDTDPATKKYVDDSVANCIKTKSTAEVGQTIVVKTVDETGKPTEFEMESVADEMDALVSLSECGILIPVYQNGTFYTDGNGFIYTL